MSRGLPAAITLAVLALAAGPPLARAGSPAQSYELDCMGCHGVGALGVPGRIPPLAHSFARFMRSPAGREYVLRVPGAADSPLSDGDLAAVLNWIAWRFDPEDFGSATRPFTAQEVARVRHHPMLAVLERRREVVKALTATGPAPAPAY